MSIIGKDLKQDHISVCICTFKRPSMLTKALEDVISQITDDKFTFEVVVVDNDCNRSAEIIVSSFQSKNALKVIYNCEPEQNIALARNKAIKTATGNLIAFIDDDETPVEDWLYKMYLCIKDYNADAVLGPVLPDFPAGAPAWLKKSGLCDRRRNVTGSTITGRDLRTGNILFHRYVFENDDIWFNPSRGRTGGEDGEFIDRQLKKGRRFIWCDEAIVSEIVPEERWHAAFYLKKSLRIGTISGEIMRRRRSLGNAMKSCILFFGCVFVLPFSFFMRMHIWMRVMNKMCYEIGRLTSFIGLSLLRYRK